jgi:hypothetical protein
VQYTQAQFMHEFNDTHREHFNPDLFKRDNNDIVKAIYNVLKSCERDKYFTLRLVDFEVISDYEAMYNKLRDHEEKRRKKNDKTENLYDFINIRDTDMMLIKINWLIRHNDVERQDTPDNKSIEVLNPEEIMEVLIAVPRFVRKYYFRLNGNYYTTIFQIVDGSTYNNSTANQSKSDTVSLKTTFSPVRMFRGFQTFIDINTNKEYKLIEYSANIFYTSTNAIFYLLAAYGMYGCMNFLQINCVGITTQPVNSKDYVCFEKQGIYVSCPKQCINDPMVQALVVAILTGILKDATHTDLFDQRYWLRVLGMHFKNASVDKGLFVLDSVDGIYDITTQEDLHLPDEMKTDIYAAIRWVIQEFSNLRQKENTDVTTKRIRIADYIAQVYATRLNYSLYSLADMGRRVTLAKIKQRVYSAPLYLLNQISKLSNLVEYRDMVNDNDATVALKYTYKGISGLGEDGSSVQPIYKYVDPSHIGIIDLDSSSNSDPGMSGMLCPMAKMYGRNFSKFEEPHEWYNKYKKLEKRYYRKYAESPIIFDQPPEPFHYKERREKIVQEEIEFNKIICPIINMDNPDITYASYQSTIEDNREQDKTVQSLFTIIKDETGSGNDADTSEQAFISDDFEEDFF